MINQSESVFRKILTDVSNGNKVSPRGQLVLEIENYNYTLPPKDGILTPHVNSHLELIVTNSEI
jgi:hypothetical protein